jgi:hypothetical protein
MDFETWFQAEVVADRLYSSDEEAARRAWNGAIQQSALAAWERGTQGNEPGTTISRRVISGLIADEIRTLIVPV